MVVVALYGVVEPVEGVEATVGRGVLPVAEAKVPLAHDVGGVAEALEVLG